MMCKRACVLFAVASLAAPASAAAQGLGLGVRVGTLGLGGEAAIGLTDRILVRGGIGTFSLGPVEFEPSATFDDIDVTLTLPAWYNAGIDLYLNGAIRIGGGMLFKADDPELTGSFNQPQEIGGVTFTQQEIGTLKGVIDSSDTVPYALLGFGKHTSPGIGLFLDVGVAFLGDPDVTLTSEGGTRSNDPAMQSALAQEAQDFEDDMRAYLKFWPILSLGLRIGLG